MNEARQRLAPGWADKQPPRKILSAMGHPGYSDEFAELVLRELDEHPELRVHNAIHRVWKLHR